MKARSLKSARIHEHTTLSSFCWNLALPRWRDDGELEPAMELSSQILTSVKLSQLRALTLHEIVAKENLLTDFVCGYAETL